ncbi:M14 family metallopeptidase [Paenisporosarcina sp. OV554]|uniref:M14 family metallopeptidase n=1 Tax=Paenisporosarcina sp. OV554 TaxID=2135694 RepID=UPI000D3DA214|nr:M14 family metallopeptidase [Paenisporosarcina sp. OV554]PUB10792.1 zinc carboxypeptidase [Paenisporosarcina sp. OV554]
MENLQNIWSTEGLLVDKNDDGAVDGVSIYVDLPKDVLPKGLFDFFARIGLETTGLSYNFFEFTKQKVIMKFQRDSDKTYAHFEHNNLTCFYRNELELSTLLTDLASIDKGEKEKVVEETKRSINSLSDIWSFSGFGSFEEASPHHVLSLNITVEDKLQSMSVYKELCHFIARCALYSTSIDLPLTNNEHAQFQFHVSYGEETKLRLLNTNEFELSGTIESCSLALDSLNRSKHWSEQGEFGYWEQELTLNEKMEADLWYESTWEDCSEKDLVLSKLSASQHVSSNNLEVYLSEPLDIRKDFEKEIQEKFPEMEITTVRSAFKTGFHWIREELLPSLNPNSIGLHISVRKDTNANGLELPIRWIQELYPIDKIVEKNTHLSAENVTFSLHEQLDFTYHVEALFENGLRESIGVLEVPISKIPYINQHQFAYPSTGAVKLYLDQSLVEEYPISTDRERFYLYYLKEFLPDLQQKINKFNPGQGHNRPLFDRIEIDVKMSEEEEKLNIDEERTSSLEALYEDLYFNTLDYFSNWGIELTGKSFDAPGGVHPFMHLESGAKPSARIKVYKWDDFEPIYIKTKQIDFNHLGEFVSAIVLKQNAEIMVPIQKPEIKMKGKDLGSSGKVVIAEHSYKGSPIPIIEYYLKSGEMFDSAIKLTLFKKTIVIEAGHHANEISSTPAALKLMNMADGYLKKMNVVIIPNANPDGFQLLQKMIEEHPEWKHHAARYNAVGLEFAHVRYQQTVFGEANVLPLIMKKWAPDIVLDDHGIPAHEWVQPFSGYNSPPRFPVSYFLPSAKIYGIGRISEKVNKQIHENNLETIVQSISSKIAGTSIAEENEYWKQRFIKYGHQWLPNVFPIEEAPHIHFYRQQTVTPEYPTVSILRYPKWVAADIISEAADEVVYGKSLDGCIEAHVLFNIGILEVLQNQNTETNSVGLTKFRERPIQLGN